MTSRGSFRQGLLAFTACSLVGVVVPVAGANAQIVGGSAQTPASTQGSTEQIEVTGSRLKTTNATSENPVTIITSAEIARTSSQTIEDVLQKLPSIGTSGIYGTTNNGGQGLSCTDIRNLGISRTLVLVNGKRFVHTGGFGTDCVDLNNIPLAMVDQIEVLKDGASAVYGADAVAGVINIKLKKNFSGTEIRANGSIATEVGDARTGDISATTGVNFEKGNVTLSVDYQNVEPVRQADRSWATPVVNNNNPKGKFSLPSGYTLNGKVFDDSNSSGSFLPDGGEYLLGNGKYRPIKSTDRFDFGPDQYLSQGFEHESFAATGRYDFNENITGYLETFFTHKTSSAQLAPQPVGGGLTSAVPDSYVVPAGNPYLIQLFGQNQGPVDILKRMGEFGNRLSGTSADTFQINGGFEGTLGYGWDYDTFFQYGQSDNVLTATNEVNFARLEQEAGFQQLTAPAGTPDPSTYGIYNPGVCNAAAGCVLTNPFGPNSISQAGVNYARFTEVATSEFSLRTFGGSLTNNDVLDLPFGPLGVTLGAEHRREAGQYNPDNLVDTGVTLENAQSPTKGAFSVGELYGEVRVPLLTDLPFAKDLHLDLGGRFFDYNTFGSGETWKAGFNYTPIKGIRFRGSIGDAFRQPSVQELYGGDALSFNGAADPCANVASYGSKAGAVQAKCAAQGINTATFQQVQGQVQTITGGNPNLLPETARTEALGTVIEPPFIPHLSLTVDYWRTKIENSIGSVGTQDILDGCYTGASPSFCADINPRAAQQQLSTVIGTSQNLGVTKTDGLDLGLTYTYVLPDYGSITLQSDMQLLFDYTFQNLPNGPFINQAGMLDYQADGSGQPRQRDNTSVTWAYHDFSFTYEMRYLSGMEYYPILDPKLTIANKVPEIFYSDVSLTYAHKGIQVTAGVTNLFDKAPPFVFDQATNTDPTVYDIYGRVVFVKTSFKF
jgi:outer membrane receptor protein involved in Fe transport